jgi:hypothetical protein
VPGPRDGTLGCDPDGDSTAGGTHAVAASAAAPTATIIRTFRRPATIVLVLLVVDQGWRDTPWTGRPPMRP